MTSEPRIAVDPKRDSRLKNERPGAKSSAFFIFRVILKCGSTGTPLPGLSINIEAVTIDPMSGVPKNGNRALSNSDLSQQRRVYEGRLPHLPENNLILKRWFIFFLMYKP